ncbi:MAG: hypothetical protein JNM84_19650 [Planctomycetes bacterium]|nr:hypothetical protein [Planctomycetota bacterium]
MSAFPDHEEFLLVRHEVQAKLRSGAYIDAGDPHLRLVVLPSFEASFSWEIRAQRSRGAERAWRLVHTFWDFEANLRALGDPVTRLRHTRPYVAAVTQRAGPIADDVVQGILAGLRQVSIPLATQDRSMMVDGIRYVLQLFEGTRTLQLEWNEAQRGAAPLGPVIDELIERFEAQRPASSNAMHFK